jgi:hypothetical protein
VIASPAYLAEREAAYAADPRWARVGNGWQTADPELVTEGMRRLRASKVSGPNGGYPATFFARTDRQS